MSFHLADRIAFRGEEQLQIGFRHAGDQEVRVQVMAQQQSPIVARDARGRCAGEPLFLVYQVLVRINQRGLEDPLGDGLPEVGRTSGFPGGLADGGPGPGRNGLRARQAPSAPKVLKALRREIERVGFMD